MTRTTSSTFDPETVVLGLLMQLPPTTAAPRLTRLRPTDFADPRARQAFDLLTDMVADGVPTLDPAALLGHVMRTCECTAKYMQLLSRWVFDAYATPVPVVALDHHIGLLIERSYRRRITTATARLVQAADHSTLTGLDTQVSTIVDELRAHRHRITDTDPATTAPTPVAAPDTTNHGRAAA